MLSSVTLGIIALFFPPFPVAVVRGCGDDLLINILLSFFCWIPGVAHAFYIIARYSGKSQRQVERRYSKGSSHGRSKSPSVPRRRSSPRPRSRTSEKHGYPRGYVEAPKAVTYADLGYVYPAMPQASMQQQQQQQQPMYAYSR